MAEKRMFSMKIADSDAFLDMPLSTQALYFHLSMRADDEGFLNNPKRITRMIGASEDDLKLLIAKRFLLAFNSGVVVIKHWMMNNNLRKDRCNETQYTEEKSQICLKDNGSYTEVGNCQPIGNQLSTNWQPSDNQVTTNCPPSIGKYSIDKYRLDVEEDNMPHPQPETLPELDERDKVIQAWNARTVTQNIETINSLSKREQDTRLCINGNLDRYLQTINDLDNQSFFLDQSKRGNLLKYDWFCNPNNYQKVVEGNYKDCYSREPPKKETVHEESYDEFEKLAQPFTLERIQKMKGAR